MKIFLPLILVILTNSIYSQDTITTKVIIFDEEDMSKYDSSKRDYGKNAIKFNPLLLINGEIPIYYERALSSNFSAEIAVGMTHRDYIGNFWGDLNDDVSKEDTKYNSHFSYKLAVRYYTGGIALDGFYFSLEYANRNYSQDVTIESYQDNNTSPDFILVQNFTEEQFHNEFKIICGSQDHSYWDNFFLDYYVGVGIDKRSFTNIESTTDINSNNEIFSLEKVEETKPRFYIGVKIGFEF